MRRLPLCLIALLVSGCATGQPRVTTRPAAAGPDVAVSAGAPAPDSLSMDAARLLRPRLSPAPIISPGTTTVEQSSRALRAAAAQYAASPTVAHEVELGLAYRASGIDDLAHDHLASAARTDPRQAAAWDGMARIWRDWGYPGIGLGDAYRAVAASPGSAAAHNTLGTILETLGKGAAAREHFRRAAGLDPGAAYAHSNLCYSLLMAGDTVLAASECSRAIGLDPSLVPARHNLALVLASSGDTAAAAEVFKATGTEGAAAYNLGIVHLSQRRYQAAAEAFERAAGLASAPPQALARAHQARLRAAAPPEGERTDHERR
jgi:Tfp pilus assembly protein PilF